MIVATIFLAPVSLTIEKRDKNLAVNIETNEARAVDLSEEFRDDVPPPNITVSGTPYDNSAVLKLVINTKTVAKDCNGDGDFTDEDYQGNDGRCAFGADDSLGGYDSLEDDGLNPKSAVYVWFLKDTIEPDGAIKAVDSRPDDNSDIKKFTLSNFGIKLNLLASSQELLPRFNPSELFGKDNHDYTVVVELREGPCGGLLVCDKRIFSNVLHFKTQTPDTNTPDAKMSGTQKTTNTLGNLELGCTNFTNLSLSACLAQVANVTFSLASLLATLAAKILDFFVYYSTNSDSYKNDFIQKGWETIRNIANIFFIIALLYVAIKTILGLNVTDNKKLVSAVIVVALFINFSLFTTKVIIDGSNILARIFYNSINPMDANGKVIGSGGERSISLGIVKNYNPQKLLTQTQYETFPYIFIFLTIISTAISIFTAYIFFSIGILFVGRVVALWLYMIFSPIAFASYTVPFEIPGFGHKEWWGEMLRNAFLAPVFIFFLYIIILFTNFLGSIISYTDSPDIMQHIMSVGIPFAIIYMLLKKAEELAEKYAGEIGHAITNGVKVVGGVVGGTVGGLALGGTAAVLQKFVGSGANKLSESNTFRDWSSRGGWARKKVTQLANWGATSEFDLRKTAVGGVLKATEGVTGFKFGLSSKLLEGRKGGARQDMIDKVARENKYVSEQIDTTDYGKAELTKGGMNKTKAEKIKKQLQNGGMTETEADTYKEQMMTIGIATENVSSVARYLDAARRKDRANYLESRNVKFLPPNIELQKQKEIKRKEANMAAKELKEKTNTVNTKQEELTNKRNVANIKRQEAKEAKEEAQTRAEEARLADEEIIKARRAELGAQNDEQLKAAKVMTEAAEKLAITAKETAKTAEQTSIQRQKEANMAIQEETKAKTQADSVTREEQNAKIKADTTEREAREAEEAVDTDRKNQAEKQQGGKAYSKSMINIMKANKIRKTAINLAEEANKTNMLAALLKDLSSKKEANNNQTNPETK